MVRRAPSPAGTAALAAFLAALACPGVAAACAVCFGGEDTNWNTAFLAGTAVMLVLPPLILFGGGFTIYRAIKRQEARLAEAETGPAAPPSGAPVEAGVPERPRHLRPV